MLCKGYDSTRVVFQERRFGGEVQVGLQLRLERSVSAYQHLAHIHVLASGPIGPMPGEAALYHAMLYYIIIQVYIMLHYAVR